MTLDVKKLAEAGKRSIRKMDSEDLAALKLCLLSTGALVGLSVTGKFARRVTGLAASVMAAGFAVPLASRVMEEMEAIDRERTEPLVDLDADPEDIELP